MNTPTVTTELPPLSLWVVGDADALNDHAQILADLAQQAMNTAATAAIRAIAATVVARHPDAARVHVGLSDSGGAQLMVRGWATAADPTTILDVAADLEDAVMARSRCVTGYQAAVDPSVTWGRPDADLGWIDIARPGQPGHPHPHDQAGEAPMTTITGVGLTQDAVDRINQHAQDRAEAAREAMDLAATLAVRAIAATVRHEHPDAARVYVEVGDDGSNLLVVTGWATAQDPGGKLDVSDDISDPLSERAGWVADHQAMYDPFIDWDDGPGSGWIDVAAALEGGAVVNGAACA